MTVDKFLTIREVGDILQVNERTILRLIQANKIPALKVGNQWRFYPIQLENWVLNGGKVDSSEMSQEENWESDQEFRVFSTNRTLLDLNVSSSEEAIEAMVGVLADTGHLLQRELYYEAVLKRERTSTTGIGNGVALPHAWHPINDLFRVPLIVSARLSDPVDFDSIDGKPVDLIFLLCAPRSRAHLKLISSMSILPNSPRILGELRAVRKAGDFVEILDEVTQGKLV